MSVSFIDTRQVHRGIGARGRAKSQPGSSKGAGPMRKLIGLFFVALLLPSVPASASSLIMREPAPVWRLADANAKGGKACALPQLSIRTDNPPVLSSGAENDAPVDFATAENSWTPDATSHGNADMNRAVDHLVSPPDHVNVYATQTGDDLQGHFEGTNSPNETFAALEVVIH